MQPDVVNLGRQLLGVSVTYSITMCVIGLFFGWVVRALGASDDN